VQLGSAPSTRKSDEQLLDEEAVIEDDGCRHRQRSSRLVGEIWVVDRRQRALVALGQHSAQLGARGANSAWDDERSIAEVDEADLATMVDAPAPP